MARTRQDITGRRRTVARLITVTALVGAPVLASPGTAYAAGLTGTLTPNVVTAHAHTTFHTSVTSSGALIGQFTISVPTAFTHLAASNPQGGLAARATVNPATNSVTVSGVLNTTASVDITADDPTTSGSYTWSASAQDSLLGSLGSTNLPAVTVVGAPAVSLAFIQGPSSVAQGATTAPPVTVKGIDAYGNTDPSFTAPVTLAYVNNPVGAAAPSGATSSAVSGVATFSSLTFPKAGFGFTIAPSSGSLAGPSSSPFDVKSSLTYCPANQTCDSGNVTAGQTQTTGGRTGVVSSTGRVLADAGPQTDVLVTTIGANQPQLSCSKFGPVMSFNIQTRAKTITLTVTGPFAEGSDSGFDVSETDNLCYGSPTTFVTKSGANASYNETNGEYEGLLPKCNASSSNTPCVVSRTDLGSGKSSPDSTRYVVRAGAGDPKIGG